MLCYAVTDAKRESSIERKQLLADDSSHAVEGNSCANGGSAAQIDRQ